MRMEGEQGGLTPARKVGFTILLVAGIACAILCGLDSASRLAQTSDSAQSFVAGHAVVGGNILLSGWHAPLDDYYFTDTIPYAALEWLVGPRPFLLALVPALTYALFVCAGLALCLRPSQPLMRKLEATAAVMLMLAAPGWISGWNPLLMSDMHFATVLAALVALALCAVVARYERRNVWAFVSLCAALVVVVAATIASDPFSLVFAFGPALVLLSADALLRPPARNERLALLLLAGGTALGLLLPPLIALAGGFTTEDNVKVGFVAWRLFGRNLIALLAGVLTLFGANPFGINFSSRVVLLFALRCAAIAIAIVAVSRAACRLCAPHRASLFDRMLCAGVLTVLAACALSAQFGKGITREALWMGGPPMRYAMPAALFGAVLGARLIPEMLSAMRGPRSRNVARGVLMLFAVLTVFASGSSTMEAAPRWIRNNPPAMAARWLERERLSEGVGEYWSANLVTAMSGDTVRVRSVVPLAGRLVDYVLAANRNWYVRPPQFVIWQDENRTGVTFADVRATYVICRVASVAGYRIAVLATLDREHAPGCDHTTKKAELRTHRLQRPNSHSKVVSLPKFRIPYRKFARHFRGLPVSVHLS